MYEYKSRPSYHRPWHKRVHAFVEPPVPRRRTQSVDPLRRSSFGGRVAECNIQLHTDSKPSYNENLGTPSRHEGRPGRCEYRNQQNAQNTKMSSNEIDQILNNIRRSKSSVSKTGFGHDVLISPKIPEPPAAPPPPLPRRPSQELSNEYQRSPFGQQQGSFACTRRSRNREAKRPLITDSQIQHQKENLRTPYEKYVASRTSAKPYTESLITPTNDPTENNVNDKEGKGKDYKRVSVTEEEINSILENHRQKRRSSHSAFKMGSSRSPSTNDRIPTNKTMKSKSPETKDLNTTPIEMLKQSVAPDTTKNITNTRRSRSKVRSQNIGANEADNTGSTSFVKPQMNSSKLANFQNQFSNVDVKPNDGHAKACTNTKNNTESNTTSKPTCVGVGNSKTKNNNVVDYNMTPHSLLPEKPNKEVKCNTGKNTSRDDCNATSRTTTKGDSLNVAKSWNSDANDYIAKNKKTNEKDEVSSTSNDGSSPSSESEQKEDDVEELDSSEAISWNNNPAFITEEYDKNDRKTSKSSIHSNYNDLLQNINSEDRQKTDDFGKIPTDEGDKDVEEVLRDFKQRLDDMGDYIDRVKEAAVKLTDDVTEKCSDFTIPNKESDTQNDPSILDASKHDSYGIKEVNEEEERTSDNDTLTDSGKDDGSRNSSTFNEVPIPIIKQNVNSSNWNTNNDSDDIDTSTRMTIPITRMYPAKDQIPEHLTDDVENEIHNESQEYKTSIHSKTFGTQNRPYVSSNSYITSQADQKKEEGNQLYKTKNYRDALQRYSEAIDLCPECPAFYGNRSACHMMLSQFAQALADAKCSVQLDDNFVKGYIRVSKCCVALGDAISAQQAIEKALQIEPNNTAALQEKTSIQQLITYLGDYNQAYQAKDYRKAVFCLDRALVLSPASRQLKISRAECLAFLGRYGEAQEVANDMLRLDNINADAIYVRGLCLYNEDNVDKAFTHFQQVLRLAPDHTKAKEIYKKAKQLKLKKEEGNLAFKSGKLEDAYTLYSEALKIDPCNKYTNAKLFFNRATVAAKLKKLKECIQDCTSALALDDKYIKAVLRRAKSYMDLEQYDDAVRDYELANKMDRGNGEYRQLLQLAKLELKKSKRKDYYKMLGVSKSANDDEIKKAYRKRALVHHPDRHSSASEDERKEHEKKFKEIGEAYGVLSDEKKRTRYDQGHDIDDLEGHGHGYSNDIDPNQIFQAFFSQGGGGAQQQQQHFTFGGQGGMPGGFSFQFG